MSRTIKRLSVLLISLAVATVLVNAFAMSAQAQPTLNIQILSYDRIGIDSNNPGGIDSQGNPIGPDKSNIQLPQHLEPALWPSSCAEGFYIKGS